ANYNDDEKTNRFDTYIGYVFDELKLEYNFTWMDSDQIKFDNKIDQIIGHQFLVTGFRISP
ncbi:oligogalacturonate-specific porin KdgM family protein, partial [Salmonella enterica subsp. enterica serovar Montevideo]|nr:oligogalacturonate-specific porin KdgM family protein [Salmonella enterica subsp. enterica serovar Montevideo]